MKGKIPKNIAASVRQGLLNKARHDKRPFNELLQYFAMERFLYRLSRSPYTEKFILKGALMLRVWDAPFFRPTMDIDMLGRNTGNEIEKIIKQICEICQISVEPEDGLNFDTGDISGKGSRRTLIMKASGYDLSPYLKPPEFRCKLILALAMWLSPVRKRRFFLPSWIFLLPIYLAIAWRAPSLKNSRQW